MTRRTLLGRLGACLADLGRPSADRHPIRFSAGLRLSDHLMRDVGLGPARWRL